MAIPCDAIGLSRAGGWHARSWATAQDDYAAFQALGAYGPNGPKQQKPSYWGLGIPVHLNGDPNGPWWAWGDEGAWSQLLLI